MQNTFLIKTDNNELICFYHSKEKNIVYRIYKNFCWSDEETVYKNTLEGFTVSLTSNKIIYIFCHDFNGNLIVLINKNKRWQNRVLLENKSEKVINLVFYPIVTNDSFSLIYNIISNEKKGFFLMRQDLIGDKWSLAKNIDEIVPFKNSLFEIQQVKEDHYIIFYIKKENEIKLGYREITTNLKGAFNNLYTTNYQIEDQSFLTTDKDIHTLFILKTFSSSQLIYRKRDANGFSNSIILWEGQEITNCLLSYIENKLFVHFFYNKQLIEIQSSDNGNTFTESIERKFSKITNIGKCFFISESNQNKSNFFLRELFVNQNKPWEIQIIPELFKDFYKQEENIEYINEIENYKKIIHLLNKKIEDIKKENIESKKIIKKLNLLINEKNEQLKKYL